MTTTTITNQQIKQLRREAIEAGDLAAAGICDVALGDVPETEWMTADDAREEVARMIDAAVAAQD